MRTEASQWKDQVRPSFPIIDSKSSNLISYWKASSLQGLFSWKVCNFTFVTVHNFLLTDRLFEWQFHLVLHIACVSLDFWFLCHPSSATLVGTPQFYLSVLCVYCLVVRWGIWGHCSLQRCLKVRTCCVYYFLLLCPKSWHRGPRTRPLTAACGCLANFVDLNCLQMHFLPIGRNWVQFYEFVYWPK